MTTRSSKTSTVTLLCSLLFLAQGASVLPTRAASKRTPLAPVEQHTYNKLIGSFADITPEVEQVARIVGAFPIMHDIDSMQSQLRSYPSQTLSLELLAKRQKLMYLHQRLLHILSTANLQVNATNGQIEAEMAQLHEVRARMMDDNARTLRRNSIINFVSGGVTKISGYSIALGSTDTPTNILEIIDGGIQCALSAQVMKQLHSDCEAAKELPPMLSALEGQGNPSIYPPQVWAYLSEPQANSATQPSRRAALCALWQARGVGERKDKATKLKSGGGFRSNLSLAKLAPKLLDDRIAMLSELRSTVSHMHHALMNLSEMSKSSYDNDPSFD